MTTQRWTDEMLDDLASSVDEMRESITDMRESITDMRESITDMRESITDVKDSVEGLRVTAQALLQVAAQSQSRMDKFEEELTLIKQRQAESDQRFNILLEEVRFLIRGNQEN